MGVSVLALIVKPHSKCHGLEKLENRFALCCSAARRSLNPCLRTQQRTISAACLTRRRAEPSVFSFVCFLVVGNSPRIFFDVA